MCVSSCECLPLCCLAGPEAFAVVGGRSGGAPFSSVYLQNTLSRVCVLFASTLPLCLSFTCFACSSVTSVVFVSAAPRLRSSFVRACLLPAVGTLGKLQIYLAMCSVFFSFSDGGGGVPATLLAGRLYRLVFSFHEQQDSPNTDQRQRERQQKKHQGSPKRSPSHNATKNIEVCYPEYVGSS